MIGTLRGDNWQDGEAAFCQITLDTVRVILEPMTHNEANQSTGLIKCGRTPLSLFRSFSAFCCCGVKILIIPRIMDKVHDSYPFDTVHSTPMTDRNAPQA